MLHALVMAGGGGTRFWPRSRQKKPKQFLKLGGERSLVQQAVDRMEALGATRTDLGHHGVGPLRRGGEALAGSSA